MKNEVWYDRLMADISAKYPKRSLLAEALMDLLHIEREAANRRLRKEVPFSFQEIAKISSAWDISLDNVIKSSIGKIFFQMQPINYLTPSKQELKFLQKMIQSIDNLKNVPDTEFMDICNKLPRQLLAGFDCLNQFYLFKWQYQYSGEKKPLPFSQVIVSDEKRQLAADYYRAIKTVPRSNFIFDPMIFEYLICKIRYFYSIQMISGEDKECIKKDLYALLDYLFEIASNGCYPETRCKVNLYISQFNVDTNYSYTHTNKVSICFVHVFDKFEIYTLDAEMVEKFKTWMQLKKGMSIQISEVDIKSRIDFFTKQRHIIDKL